MIFDALIPLALSLIAGLSVSLAVATGWVAIEDWLER